MSPHANQRPIVRLTQAPVSNSTPHFYSYEVRWSGYDPDGRVDYFRYAVDPPPMADTAWVNTTDNRHTFTFESSDPDSLGTPYAPGGYHTFVIEAVDQKGLASAPVSRSFFSFTVAPEVHLVQPQPNRLLHPILPPSVTFRWSGSDPDGVHSMTPVKYKFKLFKDGLDNFTVDNLAAFFDSLRAWAPHYVGWDSSAAGDTAVQVLGLTPKGTYVFAVIAYDEAGAYSPVNTFDTNLLYFYTDFAASTGPTITMYNEFFSYTYLTGGYFNDPRRYVNLEVAADHPVTFHWSADPGRYSSMRSYRWCMDIDKLDDETQRSGRNDWRHWSDPFLSNTQATVGPFSGVGDSSHLFYIEAEDVNGLKSLGIISFNVVRPTFENEVLFVNDTRFLPDQLADGSPDSVGPPTGDWPTRAELDTFLFARGGVRWRDYPDGVLSDPGLFAGYAFDTLGTDVLPTGNVPLATLARYRHVVWFGDEGPSSGGSNEPSLRWMSEPSRQNNLALYIGMGGSVWMMGGGTGFNTIWPYNVRTNDVSGATVFSFNTGELVPGRFMYDLVHWRSEFSALYSQQATRSTTTPSWSGMPDYRTLPAALQGKTVTTDPLPPLRFRSQFYHGTYEAEYLTMDNTIEEDIDPDPYVTTYASMMDTLYVTLGGPGTGRPIMTYYHGSENAPILFSGFPLWYFRKAQGQALGDWVFQSLWGMQRAPGPRSAP